MNSSSYRICNRCIMDTTAKGIKFNESGECNFCDLHDKLDKSFPLNEEGNKKFETLLNKIKKSGKKKKYDCIVGISGGRDSTYLLYAAVKIWKLKPLAVHFNNGFDNPTAGENMKRAVKKLNVDLRTITSDWRESKDLRVAFLKSSTPNLEVDTDIGIFAALYGVAAKENIRYIITGQSFRTEGILPLIWNYIDPKYLKSIHNLFGSVKLRKWKPFDPGFNLGFLQIFYYAFIKRIKTITPMYYFQYVRQDVDKIIKEELEWVNSGAHYFDDLYQSLLFFVYRTKFGIDKRRPNYSALIRSKQLTRDEALEKMKTPYEIEDPKIIDLCIKRLGITKEKFQEFLDYPPKTFLDYPNCYYLLKLTKPFIKLACKLQLIPVGTYDKYFNCL